MAEKQDDDPLKAELDALLLVTVSAKNSFFDAHYPGVVPPAFINELGWFVSIIQQLLLVQTRDEHESEQFDAVIHVICQCYQTLEGVSSRLSRAGHGELDSSKRSSLLRCYIKEQLQDEIEGLRDMIWRNIQAVNALLSIKNSSRSTSFEISSTKQDNTEPRIRSSSFASDDSDDSEKPLLPNNSEDCKAVSRKAVDFNPTLELVHPAPIHSRQSSLGLSDAAVNIELLSDRFDLESQAPARRPTRLPRCHFSLLNFCFFLAFGLVFVMYYGIKKHDISTGIGILGAVLSVSAMVDQVMQFCFRRRSAPDGESLHT